MNNNFKYGLVVVCILFSLVFILLPITKAANINGPNNRNVTFHTNVNITNSRPDVVGIAIYQDINASLQNVTLSAGSLRLVTCNATLRDWNVYSDIVYVNATLWHTYTSSLNAADNYTSHYTQTNCTNSGNGVNYTVNYLCNFSVYYFANNGSWSCNVTSMDSWNQTGSLVNTTNFLPVYALNVTDGLDYGNVGVGDYSGNRTANVSNIGNMAINVSVEGYGTTLHDGLAMNCSLGGNITVQNQRFSLYDVDWSQKTNLTSNSQPLVNLTIQKQMDASTPMQNTTYWQLYIDSTNSPGGNCTGNIVFMAQVA